MLDGLPPDSAPDAAGVKAKLLAELLEYARGGAAQDLRSKFAPADEPAEPAAAVDSEAGLNGPDGSEEIADPMDLLSALDDEAVRKLLGDLSGE